MKDQPLVSVYIATKNRPELLTRALTSVYRQTYMNIEVLVCDDGSSEDLSKVREYFHMKFRNFKWIRNEVSLGARYSFNKLIQKASGEFLTGLDDDDEFLPERIQSFVSHAEKDNFSFLCSKYIKHDDRSCRSDRLKEGPIRFEDMLDSNIVGNHVFIRKKYFAEIGGYDENALTKEDYDLWIRLIKRYGEAYRIGDATYKIYIGHPQKNVMTSEKSSRGLEYFLEKHQPAFTKKNILNIRINDFIERKGSLTTSDIFNILRFGCWTYGFRLLRFFIKRVSI